MYFRKFSYLLGAIILACPETVFAAEEGEGFLPPPVRDMLVILALVLGLVVLIIAITLFVSVSDLKKSVRKVERMGKTINSLSDDVEFLKKMTFPDPEEAPLSPFLAPETQIPPGANVSSAAWKEFLEDYNNLARSVDIPRVEQACENFIELHEIRQLMCLSKSANGEELRFAAVDGEESDFWAFPLKDYKGKFAVVPNPTLTYTEKLHNQGGMKETFASNYDSGIYRHIEAKIPAIFEHKDDNWKIEQPGLIRLGDA